MGAFNNYVDKILVFFDHLSTYPWMTFVKEFAYRWHIQYYQSTLSCQCSVWTTPDGTTQNPIWFFIPLLPKKRLIQNWNYSTWFTISKVSWIFFSLFVGGVFSNNHTLATNLTCYSHIRVAFNEVLACVNICAWKTWSEVKTPYLLSKVIFISVVPWAVFKLAVRLPENIIECHSNMWITCQISC